MTATNVASMVFGLVLIALAGQTVGQSLNEEKNIPECNPKFYALVARLYTNRNDTACADLITKAFGAKKAECPPTTVGSPVHQCLNKNNTGDYVREWSSLISGCEYLYIANRAGAGESEAAFTYNADLSCFNRFNSWGDFAAYLSDVSATGGAPVKVAGAANIAGVAFGTMAAAIAFALMMLLQ